MDPASHGAFGFMLGRLAPVRWCGTAAPALGAIGALVPDVDIAAVPAGWDRYLLVHEVGTHSVAGAFACACAIAALIHSVKRKWPFRDVLLAVALGAISHIALDVLSGATIRLLWPVSDWRPSAPLVAMADPWLGSLLLLYVLTDRLVDPAMRRRAASVALAGVIGLLVVKACLLGSALSIYRHATRADAVAASLAEVPWGSVLTWRISDRTSGYVRRWQVDTHSRSSRLLLQMATALDTPDAALVNTLPAVQRLRRAHDFCFAVTEKQSNRGVRVFASDVRYCRSSTQSAAADPTVPRSVPVTCEFWVGGDFDAAGTRTSEFVRIGARVQVR